ncbi:MAG: hypothetical protein R3A46_16665 [Thermomicrobiales bacterium]
MSDTKNGKATVTATQSRQFNPNEHLRVFERRQRQLDGSYKTVKVDYLDVKWRIVWFRTEHPNGSISTRLMSDPGVSPAVIQATVTLENGVTATGFGQCGEDDWSDWLEKAETRAIGRALALLGYGTQFCEEFDEIISDSPVESPRRQSSTAQQSSFGTSGAGTTDPMTPNQQKYLFSLAREAGIPNDELDEIVHERFGHGVTELLKSEASTLIGSLQELRDERQISDAA